jgi:hypothetical protein
MFLLLFAWILYEAFHMVERTCVGCGEVRHWRRFRVSLGGGRMRDEALCSKCRRYQKKPVLIRTKPHPQEKVVRSYCNKRTAMDRKYLRDTGGQPTATHQHNVDAQQLAILHANNWINFYGEISKHMINLLQTTGTRPPFYLLEGDPQLQTYHGVYDTKRAQRLRHKKLGNLDSAT